MPVTGLPYYVELNGISDYLAVADADSLSFVNGGADTPPARVVDTRLTRKESLTAA